MPPTETKKYIEAIGKRKTSVARVRLTPASRQAITINESRDLENYFPTEELRDIVHMALAKAGSQKFALTAHISGGGIHSQAEALRHGIARAITLWSPELRKTVKDSGFLTRDGRAKERRKFGLKKARKSPQWSKR